METIEFLLDDRFSGAYPEPIPASKALGQWVKDEPNEVVGQHIGDKEGAPFNRTYKRCVPFMDVMRSGYIIPLWSDLVFSYAPCQGECGTGDDCPGGEMKVAWPDGITVSTEGHVGARNWRSWGHLPEIATSIQGSSMSFINPWIIKTPPGYSTLITAPFNDESRPHPNIKTLTGLVNTDTYHFPVTFFFHVKEPFTGLLKKGTPLVQIVPIKREEWQSKMTYTKAGDENDTKRVQEETYMTSQYNSAYRERHGCPIKFT
jgi:hypothetical protein